MQEKTKTLCNGYQKIMIFLCTILNGFNGVTWRKKVKCECQSNQNKCEKHCNEGFAFIGEPIIPKQINYE